MSMVIPEMDKRKLFNLWKNARGGHVDKRKNVFQEVLKTYNINEKEMPEQTKKVFDIVKSLCDYFKKLYTKHKRNTKRVFDVKQIYFDKPFKLPDEVLVSMPSDPQNRDSLPANATATAACVVRRGRPKKRPNELCLKGRQKIARRHALQTGNCEKLLLQSVISAARKNGNTCLHKIIKKIVDSFENLHDILNRLNRELPEPFTPSEALSLLLDESMTKATYVKLKKETKDRNVDIFPSYDQVIKAKEECRPPKSDVEITSSKACTTISALAKHTIGRIVHHNSLVQLADEAIMIFSYGMDGTTGQSQYNQADEEGEMIDDHSLFTVTMTPLQLKTKCGITLWQNDAPQSVRSVRPIMLEYANEKPEYVLKIDKDLKEQINNLEIFEFVNDAKIMKVECKFYQTMIDGKILNMLTNTKSSQSCPICHAKPSQFNKTDRRDFPVKDGALRFGCQPLHAVINIFNCLLHISYRIGIRVWQIRKPDDKLYFANRKTEIQKVLLQQFKAHVDVPKQGGAGSTTTGALCRRLLSEPSKLALALGINEKLVKNLYAILLIMNSLDRVNLEEFDKLCSETYQIYVEMYNWYPMPATLHKILVHSTSIMATLPLSPGFMGEQGSEARNKYYRNDRLFHARKISRSANMADVFYRAMDSSDPVLAAMKRKTVPKKDILSCLKELGFNWDDNNLSSEEESFL